MTSEMNDVRAIDCFAPFTKKDIQRAVLTLTETKDNVRLYEHYRFSVIKEVVLATVNLPMWEMAREV
jgi:hypothetical protein